MRFYRMRTLPFLLALSAPLALAADWPQWRGPNRDGVAAGKIKLADTFPEDVPGVIWLARKLGVAQQVVFVSNVSEAQLLQLYSRAEVLLHPSLCEGFGNPLVEAMACGCPVITSNLSAMPETTGGAALSVDPQDPAAIARALHTVCDDPAQAKTLSEAGLKRVRELSWEQCARANIALYREALEAGQR